MNGDGDGREPEKLGPGALVLVVGPSGAGKDTLIDLARTALSGCPAIRFARRAVTRPSGTGEAHDTLSEAEFEARKARFALWWKAHGLSYALDEDVAEAIRAGRIVVANGSRATLPLATRRFTHLHVVHVTAPVEVRARRLAARGRESESDIRERLQRAPEVVLAPDLTIENVGSPEEGGAALTRFLTAVAERLPLRLDRAAGC